MSNDTNVTAAVIDSDGQTWAGAAWSANVVGYRGPGLPTYLTTGQQIAAHKDGFLDVAGNLAVTLAANDAIAPYGTEWELSIQPLASVEPSRLRFRASGASLDISTLASQQIIPPRVESSALRVSYADGQIYPLPKIPAFYVTAEGGLRFWNGQEWATGGGGVGEFLPLVGGALTGPLSVAGLLSLAQGLYANGNVTTAGNLTAVNGTFFGPLLSTGPTVLPNGTDLNGIEQNGFFVINSGAVNAPPIFGGDQSGIYFVQWAQSGAAKLQFLWAINDALGRIYSREFTNYGWKGWTFINGIENNVITPQNSGGLIEYNNLIFSGFYNVSDPGNNASSNQPPVSDYRTILMIVVGLDDGSITAQMAFCVATVQVFIRINWYGWTHPWQQLSTV